MSTAYFLNMNCDLPFSASTIVWKGDRKSDWRHLTGTIFQMTRVKSNSLSYVESIYSWCDLMKLISFAFFQTYKPQIIHKNRKYSKTQNYYKTSDQDSSKLSRSLKVRSLRSCHAKMPQESLPSYTVSSLHWTLGKEEENKVNKIQFKLILI